MKKSVYLLVILLTAASFVYASPEMMILQQDLFVEAGNAEGTSEYEKEKNSSEIMEVYGVHVYIRKKSGIESVMLLETTKDPEGKQANYAYRALEYNSINGDEIRYLDGKVLDSQYAKYSLVSSTTVNHPVLGECFHIYIPPVVEFGYPWARSGTVHIGKGMFINIRTFSKKYADYTGTFQDNPFMFDFQTVVKKNPPQPKKLTLTDDYNPEAAEKLNEIAAKGNGLLRFSKGPESITEDLLEAVDAINPKQVADVVFAIDTTGSMKDDLQTLRTKWIPKFFEQLKDFEDIRIGLLFYRDYGGNYNYKTMPVKFYEFTNDFMKFRKNLASVSIYGNEGGDVPEAVYEAIYSSIEFYEWRDNAQKKIILIGDAEPHPEPRGTVKVTQQLVTSMAAQKNITLDCIIVPDDKAKARGR